MTIAPLVHKVRVKAPPARAFDLFASHMGRWWPKGRTVGKADHVAVVLEPRAGGQWFERDAQGVETHWGKVLAWEPPTRLLLGWQLTSQFAYDPDFMTEVEVTFQPLANDGTLVTLEHRQLERYGADAEKIAAQLGGGWPTMLNHYADLASTQV